MKAPSTSKTRTPGDPLFWVVRETAGERSVFLQPASSTIYGWLRSAIAGHEGKMVEIHELDRKTERLIPKKMIGRALSQREAKALLKKIEK